MSDRITLESVDVSGGVREAAENAGLDRRSLLRRGAVAGGGFVAGGVLFGGLASPASAAISTKRPSKTNDVKILQYAMTLELLEAAFYEQAVDNLAGTNFGGNSPLTKFARTVAKHEANHVSALRKALGSKAVTGLEFDFGDTVTDPTTFIATAVVLEDTGVRAYAGQGPNISQRAIVQVALSIHSVEARHAAWARFLKTVPQSGTATADLPAPKTYDSPASEKTVLAAVKETGFIDG